MLTENDTGLCPSCGSRMLVRHCLNCGFSRPTAGFHPEPVGDLLTSQKREACASRNRDEMIRLVGTYNLTIPAKGRDEWRATRRTLGVIPGVPFSLVIFATNGIVGFFEDPNGKPFFGHTDFFSGEIEPLFSSGEGSGPKPVSLKKPRKKSARQELLDSL